MERWRGIEKKTEFTIRRFVKNKNQQQLAEIQRDVWVAEKDSKGFLVVVNGSKIVIKKPVNIRKQPDASDDSLIGKIILPNCVFEKVSEHSDGAKKWYRIRLIGLISYHN